MSRPTVPSPDCFGTHAPYEHSWIVEFLDTTRDWEWVTANDEDDALAIARDKFGADEVCCVTRDC